MRYTLSEAASGLRRNATATLSVIVTMWVSLALFGLGILAAQQVDLIKGYWYDKVEISVFLCAKDTAGPGCTSGQSASDAERAAIRATLEANPDVATVYEQSKAEVYAEFKVAYKDSPILGSVTADDMQGVFRVKLKNPQEYQSVRTSVLGMPGVQNVQDLRGILDPLFGWLNLARWRAVGAAGLLLLAAALQIGNTIRMAAFTRRRELEIMRLVGAGKLTIMLPFLLEALVAALAGAALACASLAILEQAVILGKAKPAVQSITWVGWEQVGIAMAGLVAVAVALSIIPTLFATRRFLKV